MIYVIGDIHGNKDKYDEMLSKISPKEIDAVFVLGDIIDIGDDSVEILQDMMYRANIYPVLGEHEYMAKKILPLITDAKTIDEAKAMLSGDDKADLEKWLTMKSEKTISDFLSLDSDDKEGIIVSIQTADERQPGPTNGMPASSKRPCSVPSSPNPPCNARQIASTIRISSKRQGSSSVR